MVVQAAGHSLDPVLRPGSVAIIGASPDPTKRGNHAIRALLESRYQGRIIPVHPAGGELLGLPVARGPADLDTPPDLILVCTPAATVPAVLEEWAKAGARGAVVLASGFAESGESGTRLQNAVLEVCRRTGIRVVGPNTSGLLNVPLGLNLIGVRGVRPGPLALLVQSGNMTLQLLAEAERRTSPGFTYCVGVGNKLDIGFWEYLEFLGEDEATRVILVHVEGFRNGRAFLETARRVALAKPIVVLKGARTAGGGAAAHSHTGAMAGSYETLHAGLHQAGVLEVTRTDELLHVGETLATQPLVRGQRGIALLSDGGGHATLAIDALQDRGIQPAVLSAATRDRLRALLGPAAAVANPIDLAGAADRDPVVFARALEILVTDPAVGGVMVVGLFGGYAIRFAAALLDGELQAATEMAAIARNAGAALVMHTLYASHGSEPLRRLTESGVPVIESLDVACTCIAAVRGLGLLRDRLERVPNAWAPGFDPRPGRMMSPERRREAHQILDRVKHDGRSMLLEPEARAVLDLYGVPLVPAAFCVTPDAAGRAASEVAGPVAVRVVAPSAPHKTEAGGVRLNVQGRVAAAAAFSEVGAAVRAWAEERGQPPDVHGVMVSPMMERPIAELLVGVVRDPLFGPVLTIGAGGTAVEVIRDVSLRVLPIDASVVDEMLHELRIGPILTGLRGKAGVSFASIRDAAMAVAAAALAHDEISEIEVNPLFAYADRAVALDARAFLSGPA
ncbi:MAG: acetate--CoA ligase family protein [Gemmatimonadetes bacterium]|nr:acetate--CoA ligase family protein [Gemmatimonadota bacterium]